MNYQEVMTGLPSWKKALCDNMSIFVQLRRALLKWLSPLGSRGKLALNCVNSISLDKAKPEALLYKQT